MTRFAFIWIIFSVGFALWFHSHEEAQRRAEISRATTSALQAGVYAGCKSNNAMREQMVALAERLHPGVQITVQEQKCKAEANKVVQRYQHIAPNADVVRLLP